MKRFLFTIIFILSCVLSVNAQLKDNVKAKLSTKVIAEYMETHIDGCSMYKTSKGYVLVSTVSVKKRVSNEVTQRIAQIKATRQATEFLSGACNKSVTAFSLKDYDTHTFDEDQSDDNDLINVNIDASTTSFTSENTNQMEEFSFNDKIVQTSIGEIYRMQCLTSMTYDQTIVYSYFMIIK